MLNVQQLQGSWNRIRGEVKEKWGQLTEDDLQIQGGNVDKLLGKIQQKTGESREAIEEFFNTLTAKSASTVSQAAEAATQYAQKTGEQMKEKYQDVSQNFSAGYQQAEHLVKENPTQTIAAAFGVGLALGVLMGLALRSR